MSKCCLWQSWDHKFYILMYSTDTNWMSTFWSNRIVHHLSLSSQNCENPICSCGSFALNFRYISLRLIRSNLFCFWPSIFKETYSFCPGHILENWCRLSRNQWRSYLTTGPTATLYTGPHFKLSPGGRVSPCRTFQSVKQTYKCGLC